MPWDQFDIFIFNKQFLGLPNTKSKSFSFIFLTRRFGNRRYLWMPLLSTCLNELLSTSRRWNPPRREPAKAKHSRVFSQIGRSNLHQSLRKWREMRKTLVKWLTSFSQMTSQRNLLRILMQYVKRGTNPEISDFHYKA